MTAGAIAGAVLIPNVGAWVGLAIGVIKNRIGVTWYEVLPKPRWNPPNWLLGIVWTTWYSTMGYASYIVYQDCGGFTEKALVPMSIYGAHLLVNWSWTPVFLKTRSLNVGLVHIIALDIGAVATAVSFFLINRNALYWLAPYLCWMVFDTTLMTVIWKDNRKDSVLKE